MSSKLPLKVLSQTGPILCWIEGSEGLRFPETWQTSGLPLEAREQAWLLHELPTYSFDNVDEVLSLARGKSRRKSRRLPSELAEQRRLSPPAGYDLARAFRELAERYFRWSGSELTVREGKMEELHELALRFPVVHLVRRLHADAVVRGALSAERALDLPEQPSLLHTASHGLRTMVHRGVSEGHLHLWGVTSAGEVWADHLLQPLAPEFLASFRAEDLRLLRLSRAGVSLLALAVLVARFGRDDSDLPFDLLAPLDLLYLARTRAAERVARQHVSNALREAIHRKSFLEIVGGKEELDWLVRLIDPTLYSLRRVLQRGEGGCRPADQEGLRERVRLLERLHFEVQWLLATLPADGTSFARELLHEVFFRYLIYQTHHWQLATQSGKTTGLRQFRRFFASRQRRTLAQIAADEQALIFRRLLETDCLRAIEGRVSPPKRPTDLVPWLLGYADGAAKKQLDGFGLVIHFLKAEPGKADGVSASQRAWNLSVRYGRIRRQTRETALRLFRFLSDPHPVLPFVVGIDAANLELPTPPEVFAPAFRFLRELPIEPRERRRAGQLSSSADHHIISLLENRHLRMTYHVGEEFRHLLSGLRAIAETIEFLAPRPGDRLGHAIALALDPEVWAEQMGYQAVLPRQEWLDTLVWVHHFLGPGHDVLGALAIEDRIQQLSRQIYSPRGEQDWPLPSLHDAWMLRQLDPYSIDVKDLIQGKYQVRKSFRLGTQHQRWSDIQATVLEEVNRHVGSNAAYRLLNLYWYSSRVREAGNKSITIDMQAERDTWLSLCQEVQEKMKRLVQRRELVVEVNPSSNRLVGPLSELAEHHIFRLTLNDGNPLARDLRITVNTDDPGVFNTSLAHEYYLLGETLMNQGFSETEVVEWLDWLRQNGNDSTFLRSLPQASDPRIRALLRRIKSNPRHRRLRERLAGGSPYDAFWKKLKRGGSGGR